MNANSKKCTGYGRLCIQYEFSYRLCKFVICLYFIYFFFLAKSPELNFTRMCRKRADYASVWSDLMSRNVTADRRILLLLQHRDRAWFHIIFFRTTRFLRAYNHLRLLCIPLYAYLISLIGKTSVRNRAVYNCLIHIYIFFIFGFFFYNGSETITSSRGYSAHTVSLQAQRKLFAVAFNSDANMTNGHLKSFL